MAGTREALLDAAYDAAVAGDWQRIRMADVAAAAGVSRQTLYNEFGSKDQLAAALTGRETERFLDGIDAAVDATDPPTPADAVRAAVRYTFETAGDNPLVKAVLIEDSGLLPFLTTRAEPLIRAARERMLAKLAERWPALDPAEAEVVAESVTRLVVSYLVLPSDSHAAHPEAMATRLSHLVDRLLAEPADANRGQLTCTTRPAETSTEVPDVQR